MNIWRVGGLVVMAGIALFLVTLLLKLLVVGLAAGLLIRVVAGQLASRYGGRLGRGNWSSAGSIAIDDPTYRSPMNRSRGERIVPIG